MSTALTHSDCGDDFLLRFAGERKVGNSAASSEGALSLFDPTDKFESELEREPELELEREFESKRESERERELEREREREQDMTFS